MDERDPTTESLRAVQSQRERSEREQAEHADTPEAERAAKRRADKAGYLRSKLEEQAEAERSED